MSDEKAISMPVKDIPQLKVLLAAWYSFLREESDNFSKGDFSRYLKTPVIYDLSRDEIEILFTGSEELLGHFRDHVFRNST